MSRYDGLIIPRSYSEYINKTDAATLSQALQLSGVMDNAPAAQSTKPAKSGGIFASNAVIMASNKTLSGVAISAGSVVRVLFTAALTGSNATTGLTLTYNGNAYAVKVGKNGALANFLASNIDGSYIYCQAYTTLELMFDGTQFIIMGNPVVISNADYTIYTDGSVTNKTVSPLHSSYQYGNISTPQTLYVSYDLTDLRKDAVSYSCFLRLGGASNNSFCFSFNLSVTYTNWAFSINSQSTDKASLNFNPSTNVLTMTILDKAIGLYIDKLYITQL